MTTTDFVAAQQRIAARRQARETATQARLAAQQSSYSASRISQLPFPLNRIFHSTLLTWSDISGRSGTYPSFRVGQVDAELLDEELLQLLKGQVSDGVKYFGSHMADDWSAEILLVLRAVLWKLTIWDHDATYGAALQNLKFTDARGGEGGILKKPTNWQKASYGLVTVLGKYGWGRWEEWLRAREDGYESPSEGVRRLGRMTKLISTVYSTAGFASFLVFLINGRYRTLLDRVLRLRLATPTSQVSREVSFEYLNRQLVWHAFTEFLLFILPLMGISRWRRWLARAWRRTKSIVQSKSEEEEDIKAGEFAFLPERTCAICYQDQNVTNTSEAEILAATSGIVGSTQTDITNPYETVPCSCIYCFVCLAGRLEAEEGEGWTCLRCAEEVKECRPWSGDVLEEISKKDSRPGSTKSVGFKDTQEMAEMEPRPEEDFEEESKQHEDKDDRSFSDSSQLGEDEAYYEEEEGEMEDEID